MSSSRPRSAGCKGRLRGLGARKVWLQLNREGITVARCTVERLMRELDLAGARRRKRVRSTVPAWAAAWPADLVRRQVAGPFCGQFWGNTSPDHLARRPISSGECGP